MTKRSKTPFEIPRKPVAIVIMGMHRSGTSALTRVINLLGADLPNDLMPPTRLDNERGFWESKYLGELHESLFRQMGMNWQSIDPLEEDWTSSALAKKYHALFLEFLENTFADSELFVLKDPRMCRLAPLWMNVFKEFGVTPKFIISLRHHLEVAHSLQARDQLLIEKSRLLWLCYNLEAEFYTRNNHRTFLTYESLLQDWQSEVRRISTELEITWPISPLLAHEGINSFLTSDLKHHNFRNSAHSQKHAKGWLENTYEILLSQIDNQFDANTIKRLDQIRGEFLLARTSFSNLVNDLEEAIRVTTNEKDEVKRVLAAHQKSNDAENANFNEVAEKLRIQIVTLENELSQKKEDTIALKKELRTKITESIVLKQQLREKVVHVKYLKERISARDAQNLELEEKYRKTSLEHKRIKIGHSYSLTRVKDIENSFSYKLGRFLTFPFRFIYDLLIKPFRTYPENLRLGGELLLYSIRHPFKVLKLINYQFILNIFTTFFRNPRIALKVVSHYKTQLTGIESNHQEKWDYVKERIKAAENERDLVSLICINYNGVVHLRDALNSLEKQDYDDFEIIVVDNASTDNSAQFVKQYFPQIKLVVLQENVGFAEANNIAVEIASGKYLCLVNNDGLASKSFVTNLVNCIRKSDDIGAVGAKILFWTRFVTLELEIKGKGDPESVLLDESSLENSLTVYRKWFLGQGWHPVDTKVTSGAKHFFTRQASLKIAVCKGQERIALRFSSSAPDPVILSIKSSISDMHSVTTLNSESWHEIVLDFTDRLEDPGLEYIVNNAGTWVNSEGDVGDIGFAETDIGQFEKDRPVEALCGCAMMVRRSALLDKPLFLSQFFAYFEDTELSLRLREDGYNLKYCHSAIFYHKHASTSGENSPFFRFYVNRNRILFLAIHFAKSNIKLVLQRGREQLLHLQKFYLSTPEATIEDKEFGVKIDDILIDWEVLIPKIIDKTIYNRPNYFPKMGIYNNFWHTLGGGEHHACVVCQALQFFGPVDLISENDFSIADLEIQFDIDLKYCRKKIVSAPQIHHIASTTQKYDLFINSTFGSDLISHAKHSIYLVSFPFRVDKSWTNASEFIRKYTFWANSKYTQYWIKKWWQVDSRIVYPSVYVPSYALCQWTKDKIILHVGRFFEVGHNKKQFEIARIFRRLEDAGNMVGWRLIFVGQVADGDMPYVNKVKSVSSNYSIEIRNNLPLNELRDLFNKAALYIHATGLNEESNNHPELNEHFGISTVEAMAHGCVPVVINKGGQPEIIIDKYNGFLFDDEKGALLTLAKCINLFEKDQEKFLDMQHNARSTAEKFSRPITIERIKNRLKDYKYNEKDLS